MEWPEVRQVSWLAAWSLASLALVVDGVGGSSLLRLTPRNRLRASSSYAAGRASGKLPRMVVHDPLAWWLAYRREC